MFRAYGDGHRVLTAKGNYGVAFGGSGEFFQKKARRSKFGAVVCQGGDLPTERWAGYQEFETTK